jgi:hypothetical protein
VAIGIHVLTGLDFSLTSILRIRSELKFRDPQFDVRNTFNQSSVVYDGVRIRLDQNPATTRINLNGIAYSAGLVLSI